MKNYESKFNIAFLNTYSKEFILNYERELINLMNSDIFLGFRLEAEMDIKEELFNVEYVQSDEFEIDILEKALTYVNKSSRVLIKLINRDEDRDKTNKVNRYLSVISDNTLKTIFISRRLKQLGINVDLKNTIEKKSYSKTKPNTLYGKQINLYERYLIADEILQIDNKISVLKISVAEKQNLLSLILGCNIDNAKKIMNGNYDAKVKEDILKDYFKTLKK